MINVVCVKWGDKFSNDYVYNLEAGVKRNTTQDINFICYSDKKIPGVNTVILDKGLDGWWNKLQLFKLANSKSHMGLSKRYVLFDLDTIITGNIDWLLDYDGEFMGIENLGINNSKYEDIRQYEGVLQSGILAWDSLKCSEIWDWFKSEQEGIIQKYRGDGEFLHALIDSPDLLQRLYPDKLRSYKYECHENGLPEGPSIVCFHGQPSIEEAISTTVHPWGVTYEPREWVKDYWKI
jgi:hypothetical protein